MPAGFAAAGLSHVRASAALAAHQPGHVVDQIAGLDHAHRVFADAGDQTDFAVLHRAEHHDCAAELLFEPVHRVAQRPGIGAVHPGREYLDIAHGHGLFGQILPLAAGQLSLEFLQLLLELAAALHQLADFLFDVIAAASDQIGDPPQRILTGAQPGQRTLTGHRLDAPHAGGDTGLGDDLQQTDIAGAADMGAATELGGKSPSLSTRTWSSYFSPNSAIAPAATASSNAISAVSASALAWIWSLTSPRSAPAARP